MIQRLESDSEGSQAGRQKKEFIGGRVVGYEVSQGCCVVLEGMREGVILGGGADRDTGLVLIWRLNVGWCCWRGCDCDL